MQRKKANTSHIIDKVMRKRDAL